MTTQKSHIIAAFACAGKSICAQKYPDLCLDLESTDYKYQYDYEFDDKENIKGALCRLPNPEFPENYVQAICDQMLQYPLILIAPDEEILAELEWQHLPYDIVGPHPERAEEFAHNAQQRGNNPAFVRAVKFWTSEKCWKRLRRDFHPEHFDYLRDDEYLDGYLRRKYPKLF